MTSSESFFDALKSKRKSQGIEISEICEFTRIHPRYIEAIENGAEAAIIGSAAKEQIGSIDRERILVIEDNLDYIFI